MSRVLYEVKQQQKVQCYLTFFKANANNCLAEGTNTKLCGECTLSHVLGEFNGSNAEVIPSVHILSPLSAQVR
jgi:hypothetical protein